MKRCEAEERLHDLARCIESCDVTIEDAYSELEYIYGQLGLALEEGKDLKDWPSDKEE